MEPLDKNGLEFRVGLYEYRGAVNSWVGAILKIKSKNNYSVSGETFKGTGLMGFYDTQGIAFNYLAFNQLIRVDDIEVEVEVNKIYDIFNFNFK